MERRRIWELDFFRGFAIIMMVFDHLMYDLGHLHTYFSNFYQLDLGVFNWLNDFARWYWSSDLRFVGHLFFISLFLIISGISYTFSKNNFNRSVKLLIVALLITIVTYIIDLVTGMDAFIVMGVIHMYAISIFLTFIIRKLIKNDVIISIIALGIIALGFELEFWELNYIAKIHLSDVPGIILGTKAFGADYFGIVPYMGIIMLGTVIGNQFYKNRMTLFPQAKIKDKNIFILSGKYSLHIFVIHQFVLILLIFIIGYLFGYRM